MKKIVRELHVSRNTVRKILRSDETDFSYERERQPMPKIGPWQGSLTSSCRPMRTRRRGRRLTLIRIYEELRGLGYEGGYDAVRRYAKSWAEPGRGDGGSLCAARLCARARPTSSTGATRSW
jgi:hypothetical protein